MNIIQGEPVWLSVVRLSLHLLAATVWVGGQIVLAGLVPTVRSFGADAPKAVANRFNQLAWPAYGMLFFTGVWNLLVLPDIDHPLFEIKFLAFVVSGVGALVHTRANGNRARLAVGGAASSIGAVLTLVLGVWLGRT